jgi:ornithine--oxo-acid transaminase
MPGIRELVEARGGESLELWAKSINPQFTRVLKTIGFDRTWVRAEGAYLWDSKDRRYLDMLGGFGMFNVGRNNPHVRAALVEALELDLPGGVQLGVSPLPPLLAEAILARTPPRLERVLFTSSGTEAVEAALKLGRAATGRPRVVSLEHAFHGLTLGSLSANGNAEFTSRFGPLLPGFARVPMGDLDALERELAAEDVAVFLVEPVQGKGVHLSPEGYLPAAQELCRRYGTLFGVDEVQTGFGRTGKLFAFEHCGLEPDLVTVAKSLSGGYIPVGALVMSKTVHEAVFDSMENAFSHGSTFAPNELAMAAGLATLAEIDEQGLVDRAATLGAKLLELTEPLRERHAVVRDVRGLGLMWAIEFGEPPGRARSYRWAERLQPGLFSQLVVVPLFRDHRVLIQVAGHGLQVIKGLPPLVVSEGDLEEFAAALDSTIAGASHVPRSMAGFALTAAGIR